MADLAVNGLLSPEGDILKEPSDVERALTALWEAAGQKPEEEPSEEAKTRVCMANLVVVAQFDGWNDLSEVLARLARQYPTRILALLLDDPHMAGCPPQQVRAAVSSVCHVPQPGRPQVCAEQVLLRTGSESGAGMERVLFPLTASDLPLLAWWTVDAAPRAALLESLRQWVDRLVFDAGLASFPRLLDPGRCVTRELGWYRSYRWRAVIAQLFDEADPRTPQTIERVRVVIHGAVPTDRLDVVWMIAFLGGQLGWQPGRLRGPGRWEFRSPTRTVEAMIEDRSGPGRGLSTFEVYAGESHFQFARCGENTDEFRIMISDALSCRMPRSIQISRRDRADSLAVALTGRAVDRSYDRAVRLAVWMAEAFAPGRAAP